MDNIMVEAYWKLSNIPINMENLQNKSQPEGTVFWYKSLKISCVCKVSLGNNIEFKGT